MNYIENYIEKYMFIIYWKSCKICVILHVFLMKLNLMKIEYDIFNEIEYDKLYPSSSAPAHIYGTPKMNKFSSSDSFPKLCPIVQPPNLARFLCDLHQIDQKKSPTM